MLDIVLVDFSFGNYRLNSFSNSKNAA